jgi:hypothetical protein
MDDLRFNDEQNEEPKDGFRDEPRKIWGLAAAILGILVAVAALYYFIFLKKPEAPAPAPVASESVPPGAEETVPGGPVGEPLAFPAVALADSDPAIREFAAALSSNPEFARWLMTKDLLRKFVVSVDNVANGLSPKPHVDFFAPSGEFRAVRTKQGTAVDTASYSRYDPVTAAALSMDAAAAARLYRAVKPLLQEAYAELGYPGVDFDDTLVRAMAELLETPVVDGPVRLEQKVLSYAMTDATLEALSPAQKQLFRMGPAGVRTVHDKIRELAAALAVAGSRLPRTRTYTPEAP